VGIRRSKTPAPIEVGPRALTAATAIVDLGEGSSWKTWKFGNQSWQAEVWRLYDIVPEFRFLLGRIGDSVSQARLYVTEVDETGEETGETEDPRIRRLAAVPLGTGSQRDENLRLAGVDLAGAGECWIVGEGAATRPEQAEGSWYVVTGSAIKRTGSKITVRRPKVRGGSTVELVDGRDFLIRSWGSHPNDVDQADSFSRAAIVPLREIELLTKREFAELDSRLTGAGVWFLPEGIDFPHAPGEPNDITGFMAYMQRAAAASMVDQSTASAMVPIMATIPAEYLQYLDAMKPINFWSELSGEIGDMKDRAILRVARSAELPSEVLTGIGDMNHWSGWLVSEEGIRWIRRYLGLIADALTRGFLQVALKSMGIANPERYAYAFDTAPLAARPNRLEEATVLHDRSLLSDAELVKAGAFSPDQMPTAEELTIQRMWSLVGKDPSLILNPGVQKLLGFPEIEGVPVSTPEPVSAVSEALEGRNGPPELEAPPTDDTRALTASLDARIAALRVSAPGDMRAVFNAASKLIVYRALELAGGRLTTIQERRGRWAEIPRHELHHHIGPITREKAEKVTEGAWNHIDVTASDLGMSDPGDVEDYRRLLSGYVSELLTRGIRHHDDLLFAALSVARRGAGLVTSA
jgi:hypothetical protein